MVHLQFLPSQHIEKLKSLIADRATKWLESWTLASAVSVEVEARRCNFSEAKADEVYISTGSSCSSLYVRMSQVEWEALIWGEFAPLQPQDGFGDQVVAAVQVAFMKEVLDAHPSNVASRPEACSFSDWLALRVVFLGVGEVMVYARESLLASVLKWPRDHSKMPKLDGMYASLESMEIAADIILQFGDISLLDISALTAGSLIKSRLLMANNFHLRISDNNVFDVSVGKKDAHIAAFVKGKSK